MAEPAVLLIHKVPAFWESKAKSNSITMQKNSQDFPEITEITEQERELLENLESDIFFLLTTKIAEYLSIEKIDVVLGHDSTEVRNWDVISRDGKITHQGRFDFWSTSNSESLPELSNVEVLVLRGNYPNYHNLLIEKYNPTITLFYPATSLFFPHFMDRMRKIIPEILSGRLPEEISSEYLVSLSKQAIFSKIKKPVLKEEMTDLETLEFRKLFRNFLESCIKKSSEIRERKSPGRYSIVLFDEPSNAGTLANIYPNSRLLKFNKASSPIIVLDPSSTRKFDLLFTGTTIQKTKNHQLFYEIVDDLLSINPKLKIAIVGVTSDMKKIRKRWPSENVELFGRISKEELCKLYNESKHHIITSGRDCFPRTIPESIVCGCHLLVLDIISDGLTIIEQNPLVGTVIDTNEDILTIESSYNVSLKMRSDSLIEQINTQLLLERDHLLIATLGGEIFSVDAMVQLDMIWQEVDLSLRKPMR